MLNLCKDLGEWVLDLGCGTGELTKAIAEAGCVVIGVDSSPTMVHAAREKGEITGMNSI